MVPLLPGGFGAAGALARSPTTTGTMKAAVAANMPVATSTRPRGESTSEVFVTIRSSRHQETPASGVFSEQRST